MATVIPPNRARFTLDEILAITDGTLVRRGSCEQAWGVGTDTRRLTPGCLFVALRGANFDGHEFLDAAHAGGASMFVVSQHVQPPGEGPVVRVPDTLDALGKLGLAHRRRWTRQIRRAGRASRVVAITGSAGKTTTSRATAAVLEALYPGAVHSSAGNMNNQVGIPLVLLGLEPKHTHVVIEIGTNSPGEIRYGASITRPDVGVLTLVSCAHGEGLGTIEDIAREKGFLLEGVSTSGAAIANADDSRARGQLMRTRARDVYTYGRDAEADVVIASREAEGLASQRLSIRVAGQPIEFGTPLLGEAGAYASAAALSVALAVSRGKLDAQTAARGLSSMHAEEGRLAPRELPSGLVVIDDAYNANPASMTASIGAAAELAHKLRRPLVLVLGEMRELGMRSVAEHELLGAVARESGANRIVAVAGNARHLAEVAASGGAEARFVLDATAAVRALDGLTGKEVVLVKGSHSVGLDVVVEALRQAGAAR